MANIYKSKYTGAQVDDAIEKVLKAAPESGNELQKKLKEGTNITIATDGTISATNPIAATATDDDVVVLTGSGGTNSVSYDAKHAKKGPANGYTSENTTTSISGSGGTIKIPQITVDNYGHVTAAADEDVTITMPDAGANYSVVELTNNQTTLTQEQYNTLIASPFNKIKYSDHLYILYSETTTSDYLVYTTNYLNYGNCIRISKSTKAITKENVTSLTVNNYSVMNYIGAKDKSSNAATENGNTYLKLYTNGTKKSQFNIKGEGATTITSDESGNITITSTDTKVTSVDNHYTPTANTASQISKDASSTTEATWGTTSLVTGVNIQRDAKGHVTGMTLDSIKMPAKPETSSSNVVLPFISLASSTSTYPITGTFTDNQANSLYSKEFSVISFTPNGSADDVPLLLQASEKMHYEYIYQGSDDNYTYTLTATLNKFASPATGWSTKSYTIARAAKTTAVTSLGGKTGAITLGSGLLISSDNVLSASGGSGSGSSKIYTLTIETGGGDFPSGISGTLSATQLAALNSWNSDREHSELIVALSMSNGTYAYLTLSYWYQSREIRFSGTSAGTIYTCALESTDVYGGASSYSNVTYTITKASDGTNSSSKSWGSLKALKDSGFDFKEMKFYINYCGDSLIYDYKIYKATFNDGSYLYYNNGTFEYYNSNSQAYTVWTGSSGNPGGFFTFPSSVYGMSLPLKLSSFSVDGTTTTDDIFTETLGFFFYPVGGSSSGGSTPTVSENVYTFSGSVGAGEDISLDTSVANLQDKQITGLWFHVGQANDSSLISYNYQLSLADIAMSCMINASSYPMINEWEFNSGSQTLQFRIEGMSQTYSNGTINYTFDIYNINIQGAASGSTPYVQFGFTYKGKDHAGSSMY